MTAGVIPHQLKYNDTIKQIEDEYSRDVANADTELSKSIEAIESGDALTSLRKSAAEAKSNEDIVTQVGTQNIQNAQQAVTSLETQLSSLKCQSPSYSVQYSSEDEPFDIDAENEKIAYLEQQLQQAKETVLKVTQEEEKNLQNAKDATTKAQNDLAAKEIELSELRDQAQFVRDKEVDAANAKKEAAKAEAQKLFNESVSPDVSQYSFDSHYNRSERDQKLTDMKVETFYNTRVEDQHKFSYPKYTPEQIKTFKFRENIVNTEVYEEISPKAKKEAQEIIGRYNEHLFDKINSEQGAIATCYVSGTVRTLVAGSDDARKALDNAIGIDDETNTFYIKLKGQDAFDHFYSISAYNVAQFAVGNKHEGINGAYNIDSGIMDRADLGRLTDDDRANLIMAAIDLANYRAIKDGVIPKDLSKLDPISTDNEWGSDSHMSLSLTGRPVEKVDLSSLSAENDGEAYNISIHVDGMGSHVCTAIIKGDEMIIKDPRGDHRNDPRAQNYDNPGLEAGFGEVSISLAKLKANDYTQLGLGNGVSITSISKLI
ncbi:hypothetical protein IJG72_06775 [bacterium]|nr:hypothetical protein [bacterium]